MATIQTLPATITERGNGLPSAGDCIYSPDTDTIYEIISMERIQTGRAPGCGNWCAAQVRDTGKSASDVSEEEYEGLSDCSITLADDPQDSDDSMPD